MKKCVANVKILTDTEDPSEAADIVSAMLTEQGIYGTYDTGIIDWAYQKQPDNPERFQKPYIIEVPDNLEREDVRWHSHDLDDR